MANTKITTNVIADGAITSAKLDTNITISGDITGTLATASQPNITSVGTLTGLNVSGTPTFDGLTVDGDISINDSSPMLTLTDTDGTNQLGRIYQAGATLNINSRDNTSFGAIDLVASNGSQTYNRLTINSGGDISFYEDTGTTAALFWDASAEGLNLNGTSGLVIDNNAVNGALSITNPSADLIQFTTGTNDDISFVRSGSERLRINSTGIDVTGTATMDGLTVDTDTDAIINGSSGVGLQFKSGGVSQVRIDSVNNDGGVYHAPSGKNHTFKTEGRNRVKFATGGDILFYEDTGTTAKFFWDASAERLGLGTGSPSQPLHIATSNSGGYLFMDDGTNGGIQIKADTSKVIMEVITTGFGAFEQLDLRTNELKIMNSGTNQILNIGGGGIAFNTDTADANRLDDYEEGTWTPVSTATAFQQAYGTYTKVGNIVNIWFAVQVASSINANYFQLNGLPFSYSNTVGGMSGGSMGLTDMDTNEFTFYVTGSSMLLLNLTNNGYLRYNTYANKFLRGHAVYRTS